MLLTGLLWLAAGAFGAQVEITITGQPGNQVVTLGQNAIFNISATGQLPLFYRWQFHPGGSLTWSSLSDGASFSGSGTKTLTVIQPGFNNMNGALFQCVVTNALGRATSSPPAVLSVTGIPYLTIITLAGSAGSTGSADGTNNTALFSNPRGIAVDNHTNVYVTDMYNHIIRKLTLSGTNWVVNTIAGQAGNFGSTDGTNSNALFSGPYGIMVDGSGNLYVADTGNNTIRKLTPSGTNWVVSTIAGLAGNPGSTDGSNSNSRFRYPIGIAMDGGGNLYVTDEGNSTIRMLKPSGTNWMASTIAGLAGTNGSADGNNSDARFNGPTGIAVDSGGNVYVADMYGSTIRKLNLVGGNWVVNTIAGLAYGYGANDGIGSTARFNNPTGIAVDGGGNNIYVADNLNNTVRWLTPVGTDWGVITVAGLAGNSGSNDGTGNGVRFNGPYGIAVGNHTNVYVADSLNSTIRGTPSLATPLQLVVQIRQTPGSTFMLTWNAVGGQTYQVQFNTNLLNQTAWITLTNVTASSSTGIAYILVGPDPHGFYRIVL